MDSPRKPCVIVVDDYPLFRQAIASVLHDSGEFELLGLTGDGTTALSLTSLRPDIALIDLDAEGFDPIELLREIKYRQPSCKVVMFMGSAQKNSKMLMEAIRSEANGYLLRNIEISEFLEQMRNVAKGGMAASEKITSVLAEQLRDGAFPTEDSALLQQLTKREFDVLCCIASGLTNHDIGERLNISDGTVKVHVKHLLKKLRFRSRVEVAVWASERGHRIAKDQRP
ncbi:LuxR C-terminal-related transcriptional regulator [Sutterella megalosphaeroides]|uniref:DNA-binding response regulator n=1 Tax=Sutterella megalosphaeroides TaxID=2494234 RepID=A0A2Z6ICL1_9BURK|nr:LuxR C-terminal-related transcriptional regulator [Sutterella megalosphaeroides]BBF24194.1 DNA-binding response regulator [Sutterella megalosphaeroides]